jgi:hypothetical protein
MGSLTDANIRAFQQATGIQPATGKDAELLDQASNTAFELIKIVALEKAGIRDGNGSWHGAHPLEIVDDLTRLLEQYFHRCGPHTDQGGDLGVDRNGIPF